MSPNTDSNPERVSIEVDSVALSSLDLRLSQVNGVAPGAGFVGHVRDTGSASQHLLGKRVLTSALQPCGECPACRRARVGACTKLYRLGLDVDGGLAETVQAQGRWVVPMDEAFADLGPEAALLGFLAGNTYGLFAHGGISAGDHAVIIGPGAHASLAATVARALGVKAVHASPSDEDSISKANSEIRRLEFNERPRSLLLLHSDAQHLELGTQLTTPGSSMMLSLCEPLSEKDSVMDWSPWLQHRGAISPLEGMHPELLSEMASLCVKGYADLKAHCDIVHWEPGKASPSEIEVREYESKGRFLVLNRER